MTDLSDAVKGYLIQGHHLLALSGKRPNGRYHDDWNWDDSIHGIPETPDQEAALEAVFTHPSTTGVAILVPEHVLVADVDSEKAAAVFTALAGVPETVIAKTAKGFHVWFMAPGAAGSVWIEGKDGLLLKGFGGYVVAPPSWHPGDPERGIAPGQHYQWINPLETGYAFLPDELGKRIAAKEFFQHQRDVKREDSDFTSIEVEFGPDGWRLWKRVNLDGLCKAIENAPEGNQNAVIAWSSMVAQEAGVPFETAYDVLMEAARKGNHPAKRARSTIRGVYQRRSRG